jgi:hypothetical protein
MTARSHFHIAVPDQHKFLLIGTIFASPKFMTTRFRPIKEVTVTLKDTARITPYTCLIRAAEPDAKPIQRKEVTKVFYSIRLCAGKKLYSYLTSARQRRDLRGLIPG